MGLSRRLRSGNPGVACGTIPLCKKIVAQALESRLHRGILHRVLLVICGVFARAGAVNETFEARQTVISLKFP